MALRRILAVTAAVAVAGAATAVLVVQPWSGPDRCTGADLDITTGGLTETGGPTPTDSAFLGIRARGRCVLAGPLRLQARDNTGSWIDVPEDPTPGRDFGGAPVGDVGPQTSARLHLDPKKPYLIFVAWKPKSAACTPAEMRVTGLRLAAPMKTLPKWCGQPVTVSNTFARTQFSSGKGE